MPVRDKALKALRHGKQSYRTRYTFYAGKPEAHKTDLVLVREVGVDRHRHPQVAWLIYAIYGVEALPPYQIRDLYHWRFRIESGYRQMHQVCAWTTSRNLAARLLMVGLALLILDAYMALRQVWLMVRRYGQRVRRVS